jgi:hypothetical protein
MGPIRGLVPRATMMPRRVWYQRRCVWTANTLELQGHPEIENFSQ